MSAQPLTRAPDQVQRPDRRARRGAVVVVAEVHVATFQEAPHTREYLTVGLDRVLRADRTGRVEHLERAGQVRGKGRGFTTITLDRLVAARSLWDDHWRTAWPSIDAARDAVRRYVKEEDDDE
jgi:hypothetical protein